MSDRWRTAGFLAGKMAFASLFLFSGVMHFVSPEPFLKIMPGYLPYPRELVLISGFFEVALGVMLLVPQTSRMAGWGLILLLIAVFPANIAMYSHRNEFPGIPEWVLLARLPLQGLLILWGLDLCPKAGQCSSTRLGMIQQDSCGIIPT